MQCEWWIIPFLMAAPAAAMHAQTCLPTPEEAAQSALASAAPAGGRATGFRVQDLQLDPVMRQVWVRVVRCESPGAPLILVPFHASLASVPVTNRGKSDALLPAVTGIIVVGNASPLVPLVPPRTLAVHAGDPVLVTFASAVVNMELQGTADQAAALGDTVAVSLRRRGDEPLHRMRGILRADHRVEVQR